MTTAPDPVVAALSCLRDATPPPTAYAALRASEASLGPRRAREARRRRSVRAVAVAAGLVAVAGTATAAVTGGGPFHALETSATTGTPAARNLGALLSALDSLPAEPGAAESARSGRAGASALAGGGAVRGTTVTRHGISVDIVLNDTHICLGTAGSPASRPGGSTGRRALPPLTSVPRATDPAALACFRRTSSTGTLPSISGRDARRVWLITVVPDGVADLTVRADGGRTVAPTVQDNVAIATIPGAERLLTLSWTAPDGTHRIQDLSVTPDSAAPTVRRLGVG